MRRNFVGIMSVLFGVSLAPSAVAQPTARFEDVASNSARSEPARPPPASEAPPSLPRSAIYRKLAADLEAGGNAKELDDTRLQLRALVVLCAETDPVTGGGGAHASWVRRSLASVARRNAK